MRALILGAGRQGIAAAVDLGRLGGATRVVLADRDESAAQAAAARVNGLVGRDLCAPIRLQADDAAGVLTALSETDVALSAVPYYFNVALTRLAIEAKRSLVDMGGNTGVVREQLEFDAQAREAGVVILPDCGMGPGLVNVLAVHAMDQLDTAREVYVCDAGLPQDPKPPWNYLCGFHLNGLTNEYDGLVPLLREGELVELEALSELRTEDLGELGVFESFIAAGGSTAPWSFKGRLERFETRILRLPGHHAWFSAFKALGLFSETPVSYAGGPGEASGLITPRLFYHQLLATQITAPSFKDVCLMHCRAVGVKAGREAEVVVTLVDRYDDESGLTAMERLTGWHCAVMMDLIARGRLMPGSRALEARLLDAAPTAAAVLEEMARRGIVCKVATTMMTPRTLA